MMGPKITAVDLLPFEELFVAWQDDVRKVRDLYRERKYRRCAILCSKLLEDAVHPVHKTFLYCYQAVCYESLGQIAHKYSSNRIPLLEQARDAFISASEHLPLPFSTTIDGSYKTPKASPTCATFEVAMLYCTPTPSSIYPISTLRVCTRPAEGCATSPAAPETEAPTHFSTPNFDNYSPRQDFSLGTPSHKVIINNLITPSQSLKINHKAKLSRSLSSQHALAEELVPSPLFSRGPSSKKEGSTQLTNVSVSSRNGTLPLVTLSKPLPPTPINRPLPSLPFGHEPQFMRKGKRFVIVPRRTTALSTLIRRFEGDESLEKSPCFDRRPRTPVQSDDATPVTERFRRISAVFAVRDEPKSLSFQDIKTRSVGLTEPESKELTTTFSKNNLPHDSSDDDDKYDLSSNKENIDPMKQTMTPSRQRELSGSSKTPIPPTDKAVSHPVALTTPMYSTESTYRTSPQSPSLSLQAYNTYLSDLRTRLINHTNVVSNTITQTQSIQLAHDEEKRARFLSRHQNSASLSPDSPNSPRSQTHNHKSTSPSRTIAQSRPQARSPPTSPTPIPTSRHTKTRNGNKSRNSIITPTKDARLRSFWSLQAASAAESLTRNNTQHNNVNNEAERLKKQRIAKLKSEGWNVRKDKVGFKGVKWYQDLADKVECEIREGCLDGR